MALVIPPNPQPVSISGTPTVTIGSQPISVSTGVQALSTFSGSYNSAISIASTLDVLPSSVSLAQNDVISVGQVYIITNQPTVTFRAILYVGGSSAPSTSSINPVDNIVSAFQFTGQYSEILNLSKVATESSSSNRNLMLELVRLDGGSTSVNVTWFVAYKVN